MKESASAMFASFAFAVRVCGEAGPQAKPSSRTDVSRARAARSASTGKRCLRRGRAGR